MKIVWIGFYNYSVILTYLGLISSVIGMTQALEGKFKIAISCLVISGICDMLDGKVARTMERTDDEKHFGIQIDSLCDLFCFGAFPAFLGYGLGLRGIWGTAAMCMYVLAAVIRLGYFNVMEEKRQKETSEVRKYYQGLPVTSIAIIFPLVYLMRPYFGNVIYLRVLIGVMMVVAVLFVSNIKVYKPGNKMMAVFIALGVGILAKLLHFF
ncbi:MAG: CDP-alcohol phosphatidyltransferase family protein [Lachnospiraceae bacterium]|nr:CDP-alcohol phosphatidyltransferase family protein [Robinsoniella sp.]MDY3765160.1 CDP-alcohol phosphatidyltransferase family protein [Lachnospiraceae bacterium]